jgi:hypothetical protein
LYLWPGYNGAVARFCVQYATQRRTPPTIPYRRQTTAPRGPTQPAPRTPAAQTTASARLELTTIVPIKALAAMATIKSIRIRIPFLWTRPTMTKTRLTQDFLHLRRLQQHHFESRLQRSRRTATARQLSASVTILSRVGNQFRWPLRPVGLGFEKFYGFMAGEAHQYYRGLYEETNPITWGLDLIGPITEGRVRHAPTFGGGWARSCCRAGSLAVAESKFSNFCPIPGRVCRQEVIAASSSMG